ncbi:MAG: hypothetical protein ACXACG_18925 [Candidatus Thorarchaeota archaeon]
MKDSKESHTIYIAVDPSKVAMCKWCGSVESEDWRMGSGVYCSRECGWADQAEKFLLCFVLWIPTALILTIMNSLGNPSSIPFVSILLIVVGSPMMIFGFAGRGFRKDIPKGSRKTAGRLSELAMLRAATSKVSCPKCNANIDLKAVREDRVYSCEYCGASGTIKILK